MAIILSDEAENTSAKRLKLFNYIYIHIYIYIYINREIHFQTLSREMIPSDAIGIIRSNLL